MGKFSRYLSIALASLTLLGLAPAANATAYNLGDITLPSATLDGNTSPGPTITDGDSLHLSGYWDGVCPAPGCPGYAVTLWYFNTTQFGVQLQNVVVSGSIYNYSYGVGAALLDPNSWLGSFVTNGPGVSIDLRGPGTYFLELEAPLGPNPGTYTFDANVVVTPLPAAAWLLLSGIVGLGAMVQRRTAAVEA